MSLVILFSINAALGTSPHSAHSWQTQTCFSWEEMKKDFPLMKRVEIALEIFNSSFHFFSG